MTAWKPSLLGKTLSTREILRSWSAMYPRIAFLFWLFDIPLSLAHLERAHF
jgi:hypothetical protein